MIGKMDYNDTEYQEVRKRRRADRWTAKVEAYNVDLVTVRNKKVIHKNGARTKMERSPVGGYIVRMSRHGQMCEVLESAVFGETRMTRLDPAPGSKVRLMNLLRYGLIASNPESPLSRKHVYYATLAGRNVYDELKSSNRDTIVRVLVPGNVEWIAYFMGCTW